MSIAPAAVNTLMTVIRFREECVRPPARADSGVIPWPCCFERVRLSHEPE